MGLYYGTVGALRTVLWCLRSNDSEIWHMIVNGPPFFLTDSISIYMEKNLNVLSYKIGGTNEIQYKPKNFY